MGEQGCFSKKRSLKSTLHPAIFWEMVKFVDLGVLYFSLVLPWQPMGCRRERWVLLKIPRRDIDELGEEQ